MNRIFCFVFSLLFMLPACNEQRDQTLTIAVAANMQFAAKDLVNAFTSETGIKTKLIISSSGQLTAQIKAGAPFDVFISADMKYPMELFSSGHATKKPIVYAYGKLVLWSLVDSIAPSINTLTSARINHIAIANPKTAPYGMAAIEVLKRHALYEPLKNKLVYGESISQTNQFIISKSAGVGFTAKSVVLSPQMEGKGKWTEID
ncbi:MAG: molybdate ABC transporter substrate-binding protein, partial [Ginsengibacter sp.]